MFNGKQEELAAWEESVGAEDYGPPTPTTTQVAVQAGRDILTTSINKTTVMYIAGGVLAAYLLYNYMYSEA
jgi:hypothetical protein